VIALISALVVPGFENAKVLEGVARELMPVIKIGFLTCLALACLTALHSIYRLYCWEKGTENYC